MEKLGVSKSLCKVCRSLKIHEPTEIQRETIPSILKGEDLIGIAQTGSGKTACYCLPILQQLSNDPYGVFALVLLPTKELAGQVLEHFTAFGSSLGIEGKIALVVGGDAWLVQTKKLFSHPYIVVSTPGRLLRHLEDADVQRSFVNLSVIVLDEADRLLSGTLQEEVIKILGSFPVTTRLRCQYLLFTATFTPVLERFRKYLTMQRMASAQNTPGPKLESFLHGTSTLDDDEPSCSDISPSGSAEIPSSVSQFIPLLVNVNPTESPLDNLRQMYIFIPVNVKVVYLVHFLSSTFKDQSGIIFTKTCQTAQILTTCLERLEFSVTTLHSLLDHKRRVAHLAKFRSGHAQLLVATDVGSRGLDVPRVDFVINFDFPTSFEDYVHRVGRTARIGRKGTAVSIICEKDKVQYVHEVEERSGVQLKLIEVNEDDVLKRLTEVTKKRIEARTILLEQGFFDLAERTKANKLRSRKGLSDKSDSKIGAKRMVSKTPIKSR